MNILKIDKEKREAVVVLDSDELVAISNALYEKEKNSIAKESDLRLHSEIIIARDLSQYGGLDNFSISSIVKRRKKVEVEKNEIN